MPVTHCKKKKKKLLGVTAKRNLTKDIFDLRESPLHGIFLHPNWKLLDYRLFTIFQAFQSHNYKRIGEPWRETATQDYFSENQTKQNTTNKQTN